jgi:hypothetical protein
MILTQNTLNTCLAIELIYQSPDQAYLEERGGGRDKYRDGSLEGCTVQAPQEKAALKGHGNEADFLGFLQKLVPHKSLTLPFEPFRFWLQIRRDIRNRKTTPRLGDSASRRLSDSVSRGVGNSPTRRVGNSPTRRVGESMTRRFGESGSRLLNV